jgi:hypothetical protein
LALLFLSAMAMGLRSQRRVRASRR